MKYDNILLGIERDDLIYSNCNGSTIVCMFPEINSHQQKIQATYWFQNTTNEREIVALQRNQVIQSIPDDQSSDMHFCLKIDDQKNVILDDNQKLNKNVLCIYIQKKNIDQYISRFEQNQGHELVIIEPKSKTIMYNSFQNSKINNSTDNQIEFQKIINNVVEEFQNNMTSYPTQERSRFIQQELSSSIIVNPIYVKGNKMNRKTDNLVLLQLIIINNKYLNTVNSDLEAFFDQFLLLSNILLGILFLVLIIIFTIQAFRIRNLLISPINHLLDLLKEIHIDNQDIYHILHQYDSEYLLSKETKELYQSLQSIFSILLYSSENFFKDDETETLLRLHNKIEFFNQFGNNYAVGITHNNIGSLLLQKGFYFEALAQFQKSILYAKYSIQDFCKNNPNSQYSQYLEDFCFDNEINQINAPQKKFDLTNCKQNYHFNNFPEFDEKGFSQFQLNYDQYLLDIKPIQKNSDDLIQQKLNQQQFSTEIKSTNIHQNSSNQQLLSHKSSTCQSEDFYQRIELLTALFYRKRNYIIALQSFQEHCDQIREHNNNKEHYIDYNFWYEIKILLKRLLKLARLLPYGQFQQIKLLTHLSKCYFKIGNIQKSNKVLLQSEVLLQYLKEQQIKENLNENLIKHLFVKQSTQNNQFNKQYINEISQEPSIIQQIQKQNSDHFQNSRLQKVNKVNQIQSKARLQNNNRQSNKSIHQKYQVNEEHSQNDSIIYQSQNNQSYCLNQKNDKKYVNAEFKVQVDFSDSQNLKRLSFDVNKIKSFENRTNSLYINRNKSRTRYESKENLKSKRLSQFSNNMVNDKTIEQIFENKRRLENEMQNNYLFMNYLSIDTLDSIIKMTKAEILIQQNNYIESALILTQLLEEKHKLMSHYPYKIIHHLKTIFEEHNIHSRDLLQIQDQFNSEITISVGIIFTCNDDKTTIIKSIHLISNIVSNILIQPQDKLGIILQNREEKTLQLYLSLIEANKIQKIMSNIIENIPVQTSSNTIGSMLDLLHLINDDDINQKQQESDQFINNSFNRTCLVDTQQQQQNSDVDQTFCLKQIDLSLSKKLKSCYTTFEDQILENQKESQIIRPENKYSDSEGDQKISQMQNSNDLFILNSQYLPQQNKQISTPNGNKLHNIEILLAQKNTPQLNQIESNKIINNYDQNKKDTNQQEQNVNLIESDKNSNQETIERNRFFHMSIKKALQELFKNHIEYQKIKENAISKNERNEVQIHKKYLLFCTDRIGIIKNKLFDYLCIILYQLNIQIIIYTTIKGINFIEEQPGQIYIYENKQIIRVFYSTQIVLNYLKTCRNSFSQCSYPTIIQHF